MDYDFCGWATKNNVKCSDGLTIMPNAFELNDGDTCPLVWMHDHTDPTNTLGHVYLENRDEGVYAYGYFNDTEKGRHAKKSVENGDVLSLSIWANRVKKNGPFVMHGEIKEVSLVLAGANPAAKIENVIRHADEDSIYDECELYLCSGEGIGVVEHSDEKDGETIKDIVDSMTEKQYNAMWIIVEEALKNANKDDGEDDNVD